MSETLEASFDNSAVRSARYETERHELTIEFSSGRSYVYRGVPRSVFDWLLRAPSKGAFVNRLIKDRYPFDELSTSQESELDLAQALRDSLALEERHEGEP